MGHVQEPAGIDFVVAPSILTNKDRQFISQIIADYKQTGKLPVKTNKTKIRVKRVKTQSSTR